MGSKLVIKQLNDQAFRKYGKVIKGLNCCDVIEKLADTPMPEEVVYEPSVKDLEDSRTALDICHSLYGGMPVQIGYCNGNNYLLNAVEYHRDSEVNIAGTDLILILGMEQDIDEDGFYDTDKMEAFLIPKSAVIEIYATTLHYAPCNANEEGFRCGVILPRGTNSEIEKGRYKTPEDKLLFARNKWLIAHSESGLEKKGAYVGLKGVNLSVR